MNRRPLLAWTAALLVLAISSPAFVAAASLSQAQEIFVITGHVAAQGRTTDQPQIIDLTLKLDAKNGTVTDYPDVKTNENGEFSFDVAGTKGDPYTWRIKGAQTLATAGKFNLGEVDSID